MHLTLTYEIKPGKWDLLHKLKNNSRNIQTNGLNTNI